MSLSRLAVRVLALWLAFLTLAISPAPKSRADDSAHAAPEPATFSFENRPIATLRATVMGRTPEQRAEAARTRVQAALDAGRPGQVTMQSLPEGNLFRIGDQGIFGLTPADVDSMSGETLRDVSAHAAANLSLAIHESQEGHNPSIMLWATVRTLIFTIALAALLMLLFRFARKVEAQLQERAAGEAKKLARGEPTGEAERIGRAATHAVIRLLVWAATVVCLHLWLTLSLRQFPYTRPWGENLTRFIVHGLQEIALACVRALPGLFFVVVIFFMTRLLVRAITAFFHGIEQDRITVPGLHPDTAAPTRRIVVVVVWVLALAFAYPFIPGSKSDAFKGISVLFGVMISLGSSGAINQIASGLTLMYSRALRVGDYVQIRDIEGTVISMNLLSVKVRTIKRVEVSIPNAVVVAAETKNFSRLGGVEGVIVHTTVTIGYGVPWRQVHAMLIQAAQRTAGIKKTPVPFVHQSSLDDFYVSYQVNGHLEDPHTRLLALAGLHRNIQDVFNEYGVQIMSPHYENDPTTGSPVVPKSRWYAAPAAPEADQGAPLDA